MKKRFISILLSIIIALSIIPTFTANAATGKSTTSLSAPTLSSVYVNNDGTVIQWGKVTGAAKYRVFYKIGNGSWKKITDTTSTSHTWTGAKIGTKYTFTVRCVSNDGKKYTSSFNAGKSVTLVSAPVLTSVSVKKEGIQIKWNASKGAENYKVFRKTAGASWTSVGTTTSTSFIDKTAKSGTNYTYTVRCISSNGKIYTSGFDTVGKSITFFSAPALSSVYVNNDGTVIEWSKVTGSAKYRIFYKTENVSWTKIADTTSTSYTWTGAKIGTKYTFAVRCISSDGKSYTSDYNSVKSITALSAPKISSISAINSGTQITWGKVTGAEKYKVFRKTGNGSWTRIGATTTTSFTDETATKGTNYVYTVRCTTADGKSYTSGFDTVGKSFIALSVPKISSISTTVNGVKISWGSVSKAENYRVYRKTVSGSWTTLTTTTSTSFTDTTAKSGNKYTYTVRCITADGKTYTSGYNTAGKTITFLSAPKISSISATSTGINLSWGKVTGAEKYKVFRKTADATSWTVIGTTAYTNFTDIQAKKGTKYTYTVRCVNKSASSYTSSYDATGKSVTSISSPSTKNDMVRVAESQLGYRGGKKIWTWAGYNRRVPWCNLFITWCANELGYYQSGRIPLIQAPRESVKWFKERGLFESSSYIPQPGDLIYLVLNGETTPYHIGLVEKYENGTVYTIEGNADDVVQRRSYSHSNSHIYGYATPDYGHN